MMEQAKKYMSFPIMMEQKSSSPYFQSSIKEQLGGVLFS